jgi:hypothetical protein
LGQKLVTPTIPSTEPTDLVRGDSTKWTRGFSEYLPADGWTLTYYFASAQTVFNVVATNNGDGTFLLTMATTDSKKFTVGRWSWQAIVTKASERVTLDSGWIQISDGLALASANTGVDMRTFEAQALDELQAAYRARISQGSSMSYNGRSVSWSSLAELYEQIQTLTLTVDAQEQGAAAGMGRQIRVRYGAI